MTAKQGRSRTTNRPPSNRPGRSVKATARRVRDLYEAYLDRTGGTADPILQAQALRAAELTALCESLRARALAGEQFDTNDLTRLESTAARAERALVKGVEASEPEQTHEEMIAELYGKDYARDQ
jgi:hypothetical protein